MQRIKLNKNHYNVKNTSFIFDDVFKEFNTEKGSVKEFFLLWNSNFFSLKRKLHNYLLGTSTKYAYPDGAPPNPRLIEKQDLEEQLKEIQREIDSKEREHFFIKNNIFVISDSVVLEEGASLNSISPQIGPFYIQSNKKRYIDNIDLFFKLKTKTRKYGADISDKDFLIFLNQQALNSISDGPPITGMNDIYIDNLEINIYPRTLNEYNTSTIDQLLGISEDEIEQIEIRD